MSGNDLFFDFVLQEEGDCAVNCAVSVWSKYGDCNNATGVKIRNRFVIYAARNGGMPCPNMEDYASCDQKLQCKAHAWSKWSSCYAGGFKVRRVFVCASAVFLKLVWRRKEQEQ